MIKPKRSVDLSSQMRNPYARKMTFTQEEDNYLFIVSSKRVNQTTIRRIPNTYSVVWPNKEQSNLSALELKSVQVYTNLPENASFQWQEDNDGIQIKDNQYIQQITKPNLYIWLLWRSNIELSSHSSMEL